MSEGVTKVDTYRFSENNSGGSWWLTKEDYEALFEAGWIQPEPEEKDSPIRRLSQLLSGGVPYEWRHNVTGKFASIRDAVQSFEKATGKDFFEKGCNCCGAPFSISLDTGGPNDKYEYI